MSVTGTATIRSRRMRSLLAKIISGITLLFALLYPIGYYAGNLAVRGSTLLAILFAIISFVLALRIKALTVASLLTLAGIAVWIPPSTAIVAERAILIPGPIFGIISFSPILALGIIKFYTNSRSKEMVKQLAQGSSGSFQSEGNLSGKQS